MTKTADFAATIAQNYSGGWAKVRFRPSGATVYVQKKYLKACSSYTAYVSKDQTVLHAGPATSFKSLGKLDTGAKVTVLTHGSAFDYVSTSRGKGYIRNTHLTAKKPGTSTAYIKTMRARPSICARAPGRNTGRSPLIRAGQGSKCCPTERPGPRCPSTERPDTSRPSSSNGNKSGKGSAEE